MERWQTPTKADGCPSIYSISPPSILSPTPLTAAISTASELAAISSPLSSAAMTASSVASLTSSIGGEDVDLDLDIYLDGDTDPKRILRGMGVIRNEVGGGIRDGFFFGGGETKTSWG